MQETYRRGHRHGGDIHARSHEKAQEEEDTSYHWGLFQCAAIDCTILIHITRLEVQQPFLAMGCALFAQQVSILPLGQEATGIARPLGLVPTDPHLKTTGMAPHVRHSLPTLCLDVALFLYVDSEVIPGPNPSPCSSPNKSCAHGSIEVS